jgi:hypothetical protein
MRKPPTRPPKSCPPALRRFTLKERIEMNRLARDARVAQKKARRAAE